MSASDRVLGKAEAVLQIVEDRLSTVEQLVATLQQYERRLAVSTPDIERLRDIVPGINEVINEARSTVWMTSSECADYLKLHRDVITTLAREEVLPGHRIGESSHWRFDRREVDAAVKRREVYERIARFESLDDIVEYAR